MFDNRRVYQFILSSYVLVVWNHRSLKNSSELHSECLWHTSLSYMFCFILKPKKWRTIYIYIYNYMHDNTNYNPHQISPGIFSSSQVPTLSPCGAPPPEICRNISATASGWGSFSPQVSRNSLHRWGASGFTGSPGTIW